jgi:hypothetical protein
MRAARSRRLSDDGVITFRTIFFFPSAIKLFNFTRRALLSSPSTMRPSSATTEMPPTSRLVIFKATFVSSPSGSSPAPTNPRNSQAYQQRSARKTYLGAQFRRLRTRLGWLGAPIAIKAMAAKLARLVYRMLRYGMKYVDQGAAVYELRHRELQIKRLKAKAEKLGYRVTPIPVAA